MKDEKNSNPFENIKCNAKQCKAITEDNRRCLRDALVYYCEIHSLKENRKRRKIIKCPKCKSEKIERKEKNKCLECGKRWN